jgi:hypothetical protein
MEKLTLAFWIRIKKKKKWTQSRIKDQETKMEEEEMR